MAVQDHQDSSMTMASGIKIILDQTGGTDVIEDHINMICGTQSGFDERPR